MYIIKTKRPNNFTSDMWFVIRHNNKGILRAFWISDKERATLFNNKWQAYGWASKYHITPEEIVLVNIEHMELTHV